MKWTPNSLRPQQIVGGGASRRERPRNTWWCVNQGPMGEPDGSNHWLQVWRWWRRYLKSRGMDKLLDWWEKPRRTYTGRLATTNGKILRLSSHLMGWQARRHSFYSPLWVESWPLKWTNPFWRSKTGLMDGLQSRSQGRTPGCYVNIEYQVPCEPRNRTGRRAWDWDWWSK